MKRFRHAGKKAVKFRFSVIVERLVVEGTKSWQPYKLAVLWTRRKRKNMTSFQSWKPGLQNPYLGAVEWLKLEPEVLEAEITLFKDSRRGQLEAKDWVFVLENEAVNGKRKAVATARVDMSQYAPPDESHPVMKQICIKFKSLTNKLESATLSMSLKGEFIKEGAATDPDMQSMAGSTTSDDTIQLGGLDVCDMGDFDDMDIDGRSASLNSRGSSTKRELQELTRQIEVFSKGINYDIDTDCGAVPKSNAASMSSSRKPSMNNSIGDRSSNASTKSSQERNDDKKSSNSDSKRSGSIHSLKSETSAASEPSPVQKRRLRPSADILPTPQINNSTPQPTATNYGSPASEVHKPLLHWSKQVTDGYRGVKVTNFTTSWRNGLALCAVLHRIDSKLIEYSELKPLDGKENLRKAFKGFKELGFDTNDISKVLRANSGNTKSALIQFLLEVKEYFDKHNLNDTIEMLKNDSDLSEKMEAKSFPRPSLSIARDKFLADLVEKEVEDDVFSSELEDLLENERGSDVFRMSLYGQPLDPLCADITILDESGRLATIAENPLSAQSPQGETSVKREFDFIKSESIHESHSQDHDDSILNEKNNEKEFSPIDEEIVDEHEAILQDVKDLSTSKVDEKFIDEHEAILQDVEDLRSSEIDTGGEFIDEHKAILQDVDDLRSGEIETGSEFVDEHQAILQDVDDLRAATTMESVTAVETSYGDCRTSMEVNEDLNAVPASHVREIIKDEPTQVDSKKAKALALIEKFKAEAAAKKASSESDQKKDDEMQERARRLIEQTRKSLDIGPSKYSSSVENLNQGSTDRDLQPSDAPAPSKYATLPSKHILQASNPENLPLSKKETKSPASSPLNVSDDTLQTSINSRQCSKSAESYDIVPKYINTCQSSSEEKIFIEITNRKSNLPNSERQHDTTTISVSKQYEGLKNQFSKIPPDNGLSTSENYSKASEPRSARKLEEFKSESAINHIQFTPISPTVVPNIKTFADILDETENNQTSSIDMSPTLDGNPFEANDLTEVDSLETPPTNDGNPFETTDSNDAVVESGDAVAERDELISRRDSDFNENMWERKDKKSDANSRYVVVDSFNGVGGGDMTDGNLPAHKTMDVIISHTKSETPYSSNQDHLTDSVEVFTNDFQYSSISVITAGGDFSSRETAVENAAVESNDVAIDSACHEESNIRPHLLQEAMFPLFSVPKIDQVTAQDASDSKAFTSPTHAKLKQNKPDRSEPTTSTPRHEVPPARSRHTKNVMDHDENTTKTTDDRSKMQLKFNVVKPAKMASLESFSPIIISTKEQLADELPRSRPNSVAISSTPDQSTTLSAALKNEKVELDKDGAKLEEEMRTVDNVTANIHKELQELKAMKRGKNLEREEILMQEYFRLVQRKNAIVKKQDSHALKVQQHELSKQMEEINERLRTFLSIEDSLKTVADKEEEKTLLEKIVCLVEERNRLEQQIDENEQMALEEDMHVQSNLDQNMSTVFDQEQEKCAIM